MLLQKRIVEICILLASIAFAAYSPRAVAASYTVGASGADFTAIQAAINAAASGDTITVNSGTYTENVDYKGKNLTVRSASGAGTTTIQSSSGTTVLINKGEASSAVLDGFTVKGASYTFQITTNSSPTIQNCTVADATGSYSVYAAGGAKPTFNSVTFNANTSTYIFYISDSNTVVTLSNSTVSNHTVAGGYTAYVVSSALLDIQNSTFTTNQHASTNGGAVNVSGGALTVSNSTFQANHASVGGVVYASSATRLVIRNSNFYGNTTGSSGGTFYFTSLSTGAYIADNKFVQNSAPTLGGCLYMDGASQLAFINNTVVGGSNSTTGGLYLGGSSGSLLLHNIISDQASGYGVYRASTATKVVAWYNDLYNNPSGNWGNMTDQTGARGNISQNPLYMAYSGDGNFTNDNLTLASSSPCINAGSTTFLDSDGSRADLGFGGANEEAFGSETYRVSPVGSGLYRTVNDAIAVAPSGSSIIVYPGVYYQDVNFSGKNLTVISAFGPETSALVGTSQGVTMSNSETSSARLEGFTLWSVGNMALYTYNASPTFVNNHVRQCSSSYATYHINGDVTYSNMLLEGNTSSYGAYFQGGNATIQDSQFLSNAMYYTGGLYLYSVSTATLTNPIFTSNVSSTYAGAIYAYNSVVAIDNGTFTNNRSGYDGGALYVSSGSLTLTDSTFTANTASSSYYGRSHFSVVCLPLSG